ncbi:MAG TPA: hypothetical protein VLJ83_07070 [Gemmatimonadaceae bacterium]|nr:hypothetical protein [Gemmatimonadaceae bacterium]
MKSKLMEMFFGSRNKQKADAGAIKKEQTLASVNGAETTANKPPRVARTIGLTEQRLRARNKESWMTSTKGWSDFFGRFTTSGR